MNGANTAKQKPEPDKSGNYNRWVGSCRAAAYSRFQRTYLPTLPGGSRAVRGTGQQRSLERHRIGESVIGESGTERGEWNIRSRGTVPSPPSFGGEG